MWPEVPFAKWCWRRFSLPASQWVPRREKSPRCLSTIMALTVLWLNPIWRPSAILGKLSFLFFTSHGLVIPLMLLILVRRIHFDIIITIGGHLQLERSRTFCYIN